jgi:hypothetical protein
VCCWGIGLLDLFVMNGISAAQTEMVTGGADKSQMIALIHRLLHGPMQIMGIVTIAATVGLIILGVGLLKSRVVPAWASGAIALGAILDFAGFASGTKALAAVAFAVLLVGLARVALKLRGDAEPMVSGISAEPVAATS